MKRKKQSIQQFINWLHQYGGLPYIPIKVIYQAPSLEVDGTPCFGVFIRNHENAKENAIYAAGGHWPKQVVMQTIAHEWGHYLHFTKGLPSCEEAAEDYAIRAMKNYRHYCKCKRKGRKINGQHEH